MTRRPSRGGADRNQLTILLAAGSFPSPLARGRGSKLHGVRQCGLTRGSPLARGRGSKPAGCGVPAFDIASLLARGRGSKQTSLTVGSNALGRPSRGGADRNTMTTFAADDFAQSPLA